MTSDEVLTAFAADDGEQVLAAPTKTGLNLSAWVLPFVVLGAGGLIIVHALRSWRPRATTAADEESVPLADPTYVALVLDSDFATGKLAEHDHRMLRARSLAQAAATMRAIEEAEARSRAEDATAGGSAFQGDGENGSFLLGIGDELERQIALRKRRMAERGCHGCGAVRDPEDRFCRACGAHLAAVGTGSA